MSAKSSATERRDDSSVKFLRDLGVANTMSTSNPFRQDKQPRVSIPARSKPRMGNPLDPSDYKDDMYVRRLSNYNACIVPDSTVYGVPSRAEVNATLVKLARTTVLSFTSRVVECGSVLRSLKSANHRSPGLMAIVDLHKAFVNAAALNPNGWLLHKRQLQSVIESKVPWMANASIVRFVRSFDPQNTGMIRYVKISACLLGGMPPAINELSSMLNRVKARMPKEEDSVYQAASGGGINGMLSDYLGELTLIRLIHNLYEECAGSTELSTDEQINQTKSTSAAISPKHYRVGVGMKVEDIAEALSCCCSNIEDEVIIQQLTQNLILYFFQLKGVIGSTEIDTNNKTTRTATLTEFQRHRKAKLFSNGTASTVPVQGGQSAAWGSQFEDSVSVISGDTNRYGSQTTMLNNAGAVESALIMKYESIRSMKQIPRISQDELVHCLLEVPELLDEFVRQVRNFRKIVLPYILKGTVTLDDAIAFGAKGQH